jgi:hypothetical protein
MDGTSFFKIPKYLTRIIHKFSCPTKTPLLEQESHREEGKFLLQRRFSLLFANFPLALDLFHQN